MHRLQDLVRLHRKGLPDREVSRLLRMGRNTVGRYRSVLSEEGLLEGCEQDLPPLKALREAVEAKMPLRSPAQQRSSIERWLPIIDEKYKAGVGPTAIFDFLRLEHEDFDGSLSAVKRRCAALRRARRPCPEDVAIPVETGPGEIAQVDFGYVGKLYDPDKGVLRKAWVFVMTLGYSRHMLARIVFDQKVQTWLRVHIECFEELGGVPKTIVPDNLKAAVVRAAFGIDSDSTLNRSYRELARHYGFLIDPAPPRSPEKKGKVESSVRYIKSNFFKAHEPEDIRDARSGLSRWLAVVAGQRRHGTTQRRPAEVFEKEERTQLLALPQARMELLEWKTAKVHRDSHVIFHGELYSVPWVLIGQEVELRVTKHSITIHHKDELVCVHDRVRKGIRSTVESHLPEQRAPLRVRSRAHWESLAYAIGQPVGDYVRTIFDSDNVLSKLRRVQAIVTHLQSYPEHRARAACVRALHYGNYSYAGIKDILRRGLDLVPLPEETNTLARHWAEKPRFSRVQPRGKNEHSPRPQLCPEEAPTLGDLADDGTPHATGS